MQHGLEYALITDILSPKDICRQGAFWGALLSEICDVMVVVGGCIFQRRFTLRYKESEISPDNAKPRTSHRGGHWRG